MQVAVLRVVVVVDVAREAELLEEAVQQAQPLHRRGIGGDARLKRAGASISARTAQQSSAG
jgi:hypothetical protein